MAFLDFTGLSHLVDKLRETFADKSSFTRSKDGLVPHPTTSTSTRYLREDGGWQVPPNTTYNAVSTASSGLAPALSGDATQYLNGAGNWTKPPDSNTTYNVVSTSANGLAPKLSGNASQYLNGNGGWTTPADENTDENVSQTSTTANGAYPVLLKNGTGTGAVTSGALFAGTATVNPSTGAVTAKQFSFAPTGVSFIGGKTSAPVNSTVTGNAASYYPLLRWTLNNGNVWNFGHYVNAFGFYGFAANRTENGTDWKVTINGTDGTVTAPGFNGPLKGNADTATQSNVAFATCSTPAATAAKEATVQDNPGWTLQVGSIVVVKSTITSTASNCTLNVNGTGAKQIWYNNAVYTSTSNMVNGYANRCITYMFDGTYWVWLSYGTDANTTYTQAALGQGYGTCNTPAATAAKAVTMANYALTINGIVSVKFDYDVPAGATMNINTKGAKPMLFNGSAITADVIHGGDLATFIYDNTSYHLISIARADFSGSDPGFVPKSSGGTTNYLRADGTWATPPNTNTDTNATQNHSTANGAYPVLLKNGTGTGNITSTIIFDGDVTVNPSTGVVTAKGFSGPLTGNASTATTAGNVTGTVAIENGGTGATTKQAAWKALGGGSVGQIDLLANSNGQFLRADGNWQYPSGDHAVTQSATTSNSDYPILLRKDSYSRGYDEVQYGASVTVNPSTGIVKAKGFSGPLTGNASTANQASMVAHNSTDSNSQFGVLLSPAQLGGSGDEVNAVGTPLLATGVTVNPSDNSVTADKFNGTATSAESLTKTLFHISAQKTFTAASVAVGTSKEFTTTITDATWAGVGVQSFSSNEGGCPVDKVSVSYARDTGVTTIRMTIFNAGTSAKTVTPWCYCLMVRKDYLG